MPLCCGMVFGLPLLLRAQPVSEVAPRTRPVWEEPPALPVDIAVPQTFPDSFGADMNAPATMEQPGNEAEFPTQDGNQPVVPTVEQADTPINMEEVPPTGRFLPEIYYEPDSIAAIVAEDAARDSLRADNARGDSSRLDTAGAAPRRDPQVRNFLDSPLKGTAADSLHISLRDNKIYSYGKGQVLYLDKTLNADIMNVNLETKEIDAYGITDTVTKIVTRPEFLDGGDNYTMDTITYNLGTEKAYIKGTATKQGDGFLIGQTIKKMPDNTINISHGKYTTCDIVEHPHFYLNMSRAKVIPNKKIIIGPTYFVMEDVPIPFLGVPFGFFPLSMGRQSGFIIPSYGEESVKGFFLRNGGYYFAINDYADVTLTGGIYTLGSWESKVQSRYIRKYKYSGSLSANYSKVILGDKGSDDYVNRNTMNLQWSHRQDPKFKPNSNFTASVNFSTSGYNRYGSSTMNDYLNTQTSSSVAYSKTWAGKPFSFATDMRHSQNSRDSTISISLPNVSFNVSNIYPFKRKVRVGKEKWYEKISIRYTGNMTNRVNNIKQDELFKGDILDKMVNGIKHSIPVSTTFSFFSYLNFSPSFNYNEEWAFRRTEREWSPELNAVKVDTTYGFYRNYSYSANGSLNTKIYGEFQFTGEKFPIRAIRHVMTPTLRFTYAPDFRDRKYGFVQSYQSDSTGTVSTYFPLAGNAYFTSPGGPRASIGFGLSNTLQMKVKSKSDTTGVKKISIIDNFSIDGSYNFLAEQFKLSTISLSLRSSIIPGFGLNITGILDPYQVDANGRRIDRLMIKSGKLGRITSAGTTFGYSFNSSQLGGGVINDVNSGAVPVSETPGANSFFDNTGEELDPATRRAMMTSQYYDFSLPWNISFNYGINYSNNGVRQNVMQTLSFSGSVTLTPKWGVTFSGGYDFDAKKLTPSTFSINRDLHCWQMSFSWVPVGFRKSWSFNIHIKSSVLRDVKYDKQSSYYDNIQYYQPR